MHRHIPLGQARDGAYTVSLKQQAFSAVRWTTLSMVGKAVLQFMQVAILARLLVPADFGLMALVVAVISFAQIFTDMGISNAIIHHQQVSHEELSSLYWLNVCAGTGLMLLLMVFSPLIAGFFNAPALQRLLMTVGLYFLISAMGQQLRIVAEKELRFAPLARIELVSAVVGFAVAVTWAWLHPSVNALIAGLMAATIAMTMLCWLTLANGWRPMWRMNLGEIRHFLNFGGFTMASNVLNTFNVQADIVIGGRLISAAPLGLYSLPRDLSLRLAGVINQIVTRVGLPVMAKTQHDKTFLKNIYLQTLRMTASVNFPIYMAMAIFAPEVVTLLFGSRWIEAAPLLRILALWGLLRSTLNPVGSLVFATGRADLSFKWNFMLFFLIGPASWFGAQWGALGLALTQLSLALALFVPGWYYMVRPLCNIGLREYTLNIATPFTIALAASLVAHSSVITLTTPIVRLAGGMTSGLAIYLLLSRHFNKQLIEAIRELVFKA